MKTKLKSCSPNRHAAWAGQETRGSWRAKRRNAAVLLELIVALPILVIILVASVQFGLYFQNMQQLELASRVGADTAAEFASLPNGPALVPMAIETAITQQLSSSGIDACAIILEHNVNISSGCTEQTLRTDLLPDCPNCNAPGSSIPPKSVRVTVCVKLDELMPNSLKMFGFDISTRVSQSSTTVSYEVP